MNYKSFSNLNEVIMDNFSNVPNNIDLVVGIPRSGMLPANLISLYLNVPLTDIDSFVSRKIYRGGIRLEIRRLGEIKNVLIIDDSLNTGHALKKAKQKLNSLKEMYNFTYCAVYVTPEKQNSIDLFFELVPTPRVFQWNLFHSDICTHSCFDIDGVLCEDPTEAENDDGENYISFIFNAKPLFIPSVKIHTIVSSRLEKYRYQTERWLEKNNVKYDQLVLLDHFSASERRKLKIHGKFKASIFIKSNCQLFFESSLWQAKEICEISKKPVFCTENFSMIYPSTKVDNFKRFKRRIKRIISFFK